MANQKSSPPVFLLAFANDARASLGLGSELNDILNELRDLDKRDKIKCRSISATLEQISIEFSEFNDQIYVFHYGGHSDSEFLHLLDTSSHAENFGVQIGQQKNLKLVFLNGCRNFEQVEILHKLGVPVVIATTTHIKDEPAILLAKIFYRNLKGGSTIGESFERAKAHLFDTHPELQEAYRGIGRHWSNGEDGCSWGIYPLRDSALKWSLFDIETESRLELISQLREGSKTRHRKFIAPDGRFHHLHIDDAILTGIQDASRSTDGLIENNITLEGRPQPLFKSITTLWGKPCPHAFLVGPGGMGKTVSLLRLWEYLAKSEEQDAPVPIFIQLNEFNNEPVADFIRKYISKLYIDIDLNTLLKTEGQNHPSIVLLLDGINEVTAQSNELLLEINRLKAREDYPSLQLILTSRVDMRASHQWQDFHLLELQPLTDEQIIHYLKTQLPSDSHLLEVLRNPMMLSIYNAQSELPERYHAKGLLKENVTSTGEMLFNVEAIQRIKIEEQYATSLSEQAFRRFVLEHLLPFIGWEMQQAGQFFIQKKSEKEGSLGLEDLLQRGISNLLTDAFFDTFEFFGDHLEEKHFKEKPRLLFSEIINQVAVQNLVVLVRDGENYRFLHQNFRDYFAARHVQNQVIIALKQKEFPVILSRAPLDYFVRQFLGEMEGEKRKKVEFDEKKGCNWSDGQFFLENNISKLMKASRGSFKVERLDYAGWNLLSILKEVRGELSGANIQKLSLKNFSINELPNSRPGLYSNFCNSLLDDNCIFSQGHLDLIRNVNCHPNGIEIVTSSDDQTAKVWDITTGECNQTLAGHSGSVLCANFSPNGTKIASVSDDGTTKIWDAKSGHCIQTLKEDSKHDSFKVWCVAFNPKGSEIIIGHSNKTFSVWDADSGIHIHTQKGHSAGIRSINFHPNGSLVLTSSDDRTAKIWDFQNWKCIHTFRGHSGKIRSAAFHPDGSRIITASSDKTAKIWNAQTEECMLTLTGHSGWVRSVAFHPDGSQVITASSDKTAKVWNAQTGECILTLVGHSDEVWHAVFHPNGSKIITASSDKSIKIWDIYSGQCIQTLKGHSVKVFSTSIHPNGNKIAITVDDNTTKIWDTFFGRCILTLHGHNRKVWNASFHPFKPKLVTASEDKTAKIWQTTTGECKMTLKGHSSSVKSVSFHPNGEKIITASDDKTAKVWDTESGQCLLTLEGHKDKVKNASFHSNGKHILTYSEDKTVKVWDFPSGDCIFSYAPGTGSNILNAAFSPNSQVITITYEIQGDKFFEAWDFSFGKKINIINVEDISISTKILDAIFHPNGTQIIIISGRSAKILNSNFRQIVLHLENENEHKARIWNAAFHPNSAKIITASEDKTAKVWDLYTGKCLLTLQGHSGPVKNAVFHPDKPIIVTISDDQTTKVWNSQTGECINTIVNAPGLFIQGCDFRNLHPDSKLSEEDIAIMRQYGGIFNDEDARQWEELMGRHFGVKTKGGNKD